ncbi:MAG: hypothetical protein IKW57_02235 [Alphaproteobacteria bacterium]|nr:hypothetical protein [Alphaproteobacteria bacterium]
MKYLLYALLLCIVSPVFASESDMYWYDGVQTGVGVSVTTGLNVVVGYHNTYSDSYWLSHFGTRFDFADMGPLRSAVDSAIDSYMRDGRDVGDGVKIDEGKLDSWHAALLLDYYPFGNAWRLTGGYAWGAAKLDSAIFGTIEQAPSQRFYFYLAGDHYYYNGNNFDGSATMDWNYHGPYLGTGFDIGLGCGFSLFMDFGVVLTNRPARLTLDIPQEQLYVYNKLTATWLPVTIPQLDADIATAQRDANHKLSDLRVYPLLKLGFLYRF